ncbi:MAG: hypothetical protein F7B11_05085 [Caldisphaeraceae archaeon]|nr:hypothetical protein [Caldisphaeraceae archaeon]
MKEMQKKEIITIDNPEHISLPCRCGSGRYCCYCDNGVCVAMCQSAQKHSAKKHLKKSLVALLLERLEFAYAQKIAIALFVALTFASPRR